MSDDPRPPRHRLSGLSREECFALLASRPVGRVAYTDDLGPVVVPVTHTVEDEAVVFRTSRGSRLTTTATAGMLAFQVDDFDERDRTGWSVLVRGHGRLQEDADEHEPTESAPTPWTGGTRSLTVRIRVAQITGKRLHPG